MANEAGKGDMYRSVDISKFNDNFDRIFGHPNDVFISNKCSTDIICNDDSNKFKVVVESNFKKCPDELYFSG